MWAGARGEEEEGEEHGRGRGLGPGGGGGGGGAWQGTWAGARGEEEGEEHGRGRGQGEGSMSVSVRRCARVSACSIPCPTGSAALGGPVQAGEPFGHALPHTRC